MGEAMKFDYVIDGEPVTFIGLIRQAEALGYDGEGGFSTTSGAAKVLRDAGHEIEKYVPEQEEEVLDV